MRTEATPPGASDLDDVAWADHLLDLLEAARANSDSDEVAEFAAGFELIQAIGKMRATARAEGASAGWDAAVQTLVSLAGTKPPTRHGAVATIIQAADWLAGQKGQRNG